MRIGDFVLEGATLAGLAREFFGGMGLSLRSDYCVQVGRPECKRVHKFDLGSDSPPVLLECKSHTWTSEGRISRDKLAIWNEVMYYFAVSPSRYRKIFVVRRSLWRGETLGQHYIKRYEHLIPSGVEIWEYEPSTKRALCVYGGGTAKQPSNTALQTDERRGDGSSITHGDSRAARG